MYLYLKTLQRTHAANPPFFHFYFTLLGRCYQNQFSFLSLEILFLILQPSLKKKKKLNALSRDNEQSAKSTHPLNRDSPDHSTRLWVMSQRASLKPRKPCQRLNHYIGEGVEVLRLWQQVGVGELSAFVLCCLFILGSPFDSFLVQDNFSRSFWLFKFSPFALSPLKMHIYLCTHNSAKNFKDFKIPWDLEEPRLKSSKLRQDCQESRCLQKR